MTEVTAARTLVKSPPELWAECSDAASLGRHLDQFGEIRITRLEPETAVAWEGEHACGTVRLEPSGWGTRVLLSARLAPPVAADAPPEPESPASEPEASASEPEVLAPEPEVLAPEPEVLAPEPEVLAPEPETPAAPAANPPPRGLLARLRAWFRRRPAPPVVPAAPVSAPEAEPPTARPPMPEPPVREPPVPDPPLPDPPATRLAAPDQPAPEPLAVEAQPDQHGVVDPGAGLAAALDSLGQAHHRPYSRA